MTEKPETVLPYHGGNLDWAERRFGRPAGGWIDLSTGINPWPYPMPPVPAAAWTRLPGAAAQERLLATAAEHYGAPGPESIAAAPGTQALIRLLPRLWPACPVAVVGPTYGEHAASWRDAGHALIECSELEEAAEQAQIVVVTNPNNPDGRRFDPGLLDRTADRLATQDGVLIVDEAFSDLTPELSLAGTAAKPGRLVLRSFGKFYGLAGLRLGFAIGNPMLTSRIRTALGAWPVSGPAMAIGASALADRDWSANTRKRLAAAGKAFRIRLQAADLRTVGGTDLFVLAAHPDSDAVFERLGQAGIFARHFPDRPGQLRFGLPHDADAEVRLSAVLRDI